MQNLDKLILEMGAKKQVKITWHRNNPRRRFHCFKILFSVPCSSEYWDKLLDFCVNDCIRLFPGTVDEFRTQSNRQKIGVVISEPWTVEDVSNAIQKDLESEGFSVEIEKVDHEADDLDLSSFNQGFFSGFFNLS